VEHKSYQWQKRCLSALVSSITILGGVDMTQKEELERDTTEKDVRFTTGSTISGISVSLYFYTHEYNDKHDRDSAIEYCSKVIKEYPDNKIAYINRGVAHELNGNYEDAIADYSKVIELDPKCWIAYNNLGSVYYRMGNYIMPRTYWDKALQLARNSAEVRENLKLLEGNP
jgi:tetratricopeptide (TPR) repeat protein